MIRHFEPDSAECAAQTIRGSLLHLKDFPTVAAFAWLNGSSSGKTGDVAGAAMLYGWRYVVSC